MAGGPGSPGGPEPGWRRFRRPGCGAEARESLGAGVYPFEGINLLHQAWGCLASTPLRTVGEEGTMDSDPEILRVPQPQILRVPRPQILRVPRPQILLS